MTETHKGSQKVFMEKPEIEHETPCLQGIGLFPTPRQLDSWDSQIFFSGYSGYKPVCQVCLIFVCWFYDLNTHRLTKSAFMEKPEREPVTPGLQDIGLSTSPRRLDSWNSKKNFFCLSWYKPVLPGWFKMCVLVLLWEHPKAHQK